MNQSEPLGDVDEMYYRFLDRWYDDDDREHKVFPASRPDMQALEEWEGGTAESMRKLTPEYSTKVLQQIERMQKAAETDWQSYLSVQLPMNDTWIKAFDEYYDLEHVQDVVDRSDPTDYGNDYVIILIEFGAVLGDVLISKRKGMIWLPDSPYWESSVFDPKTGTIIPVFHWALKKFSTYGIDDGFAEKVDMCIHILEQHESQ